MADTRKVHDLGSLLFTSDRDFLVKNNGDQVKIDALKGKIVGLYFSASWCGPCHSFTPVLVEVYNELAPKGDFEVVFVTADEDDQSFSEYFTMMPWLAIPFSDVETRDRLDEVFKVSGIPHLVILNENGEVLIEEEGVEIIQEHGSVGYPFSEQRIKELKEREEEERRNQSLQSVLARDYVIASDGRKVPVSELEGKMVGLYFSLASFKVSADFTQKLVKVYENLKANQEKFEIVMIPLDEDEETFRQSFSSIPWLSLPFGDKRSSKLIRYFELSALPTLIILGPDGKTLQSNVAEAIEDHGDLAYPFTPEKFAELEEMQKAKESAQTLESILVSGDKDFVIGKSGEKVPASSLVGKNVLLYFSAHWCPPCRAFMPKLVEAYHKIKARDDAFEVVFISSDKDQASFDEFFAGMPWLSLPFGDERKAYLSRTFKVKGIPMLVAVGPTGRTVTKDARGLITAHGADAYPFTEERLKELEANIAEMAKGWPEKLKHELHEHELLLTRRRDFTCDSCNEVGNIWSFYCKECDFDLDPKCALGATGQENIKADDGEERSKEGWVCDGEVCYKS